METRRKNHRLKMYFKILKDGRTLDTLKKIIPGITADRTTYGLRTAEQRSIMITRTKLFYDSFIPATTRDWNELPKETINCSTVEAFAEGLTKRERKPIYYYAGSRRGQIKHARLRLKCSKLNTHLFAKNLTETELCSCGTSRETESHYLMECENYTEARDELYDDLDMIPVITSDLLIYGAENLTQKENEKTFEAVQRYILKTERL
jgi:hypothetical protein